MLGQGLLRLRGSLGLLCGNLRSLKCYNMWLIRWVEQFWKRHFLAVCSFFPRTWLWEGRRLCEWWRWCFAVVRLAARSHFLRWFFVICLLALLNVRLAWLRLLHITRCKWREWWGPAIPCWICRLECVNFVGIFTALLQRDVNERLQVVSVIVIHFSNKN